MSDTNEIPDHVPAYRELRLGAQIVLIGLAVGAVFLGLQGRKWFFANAKKHKPKPRGERQVLVELQPLVTSSHQITVRASGTVVPARELALQAQVGGVIDKIHPHFDEGQEIAAGETLIALDPRDFELAIQMREADLAKARAAYQLELGQQEVAKSELAAATEGGQPLTPEERRLIMREPQMAQAKAALASAEAALKEANLNRARTEVKVPFTALVRSKRVDVGTQIGTNTVLAELVAADEFWIQVSVPVDELRWIRFPKADGAAGAQVRVEATGGPQTTASWQGQVLRLLPTLEAAGRMAQVLITVKNPLSQNKDLPLLLDSYVNIEIEGKTVSDVFTVDREVLREGGQVWLRNLENRLEVRDVDILWRGPETVLIDKGVSVGEHLVLTDISSPIPGMKLAAHGDKPKAGVADDSSGTPSGRNGKSGTKPVNLKKAGGKGNGVH